MSGSKSSYTSSKELNVSIGLVFYNEVQRIPQFMRNLHQALADVSNLDFELICIDNNSSDAGASELKKEASSRNWPLQIEYSAENNMGRARDRVLRLAQNEIVYFIDFDIELNRLSFVNLLNQAQRELKSSRVCAWAGPIEILDSNAFQKNLRYLQKTWWGHRGSLQMKSSFDGKFVNHSPTGHLMVKKNVYLSAGSFNCRLDKTGEDLEIHQRLVDAGYRISWVPGAKVHHDIARNHQEWFAKCYKYGLAQTQIAKIKFGNWLRFRCFPIFLGGFFLVLFCVYPFWAVSAVTLYAALVFVSAISLDRQRWAQILVLLVGTHFFYFLGELAGVFRPLAKEEISTSKR